MEEEIKACNGWKYNIWFKTHHKKRVQTNLYISEATKLQLRLRVKGVEKNIPRYFKIDFTEVKLKSIKLWHKEFETGEDFSVS